MPASRGANVLIRFHAYFTCTPNQIDNGRVRRFLRAYVLNRCLRAKRASRCGTLLVRIFISVDFARPDKGGYRTRLKGRTRYLTADPVFVRQLSMYSVRFQFGPRLRRRSSPRVRPTTTFVSRRRVSFPAVLSDTPLFATVSVWSIEFSCPTRVCATDSAFSRSLFGSTVVLFRLGYRSPVTTPP